VLVMADEDHDQVLKVRPHLQRMSYLMVCDGWQHQSAQSIRWQPLLALKLARMPAERVITNYIIAGSPLWAHCGQELSIAQVSTGQVRKSAINIR
jgi:hypothetical protein